MKVLNWIMFILLASNSYSQSIVINEVMASNNGTIVDEVGDTPDWIELFNNGLERIDLSGYFLSDDSSNTIKWQFGDAVIEPSEYLLVFASDKDTNITYWHTNFKISADGEMILLTDTDGNIVDSVSVPPSITDVSYGRKSDADSDWVFQQPSPGTVNTGTAIRNYSDSVVVSVNSGIYDSPITVELSAGESEIYYTLDGSDPNENSIKYDGAISISETTVLRAVSMKDNYLPSPIINQSYFFNTDTDLPVVSLITDPANLWDYNTGIYADGPGWTPNPPHHGANFWMDWERPAHIQFFDDEKNLGFSKNCGIAIYGGYTRSFAQKSMSIKFKNDYNEKALEYDLFPGFRINTFKSFILRNSGNDFAYTHIRDAMMQSLIKELDIDYLEYRPAVAYINGDYWGIYNIREKISEHYVANRHDVDPDNIDMLEGNMEVVHGDTVDYAEFIHFISNNDMSTDEAYQYVDSKIDLDNCLLYWAAHVYFNSQDWPANNLKYWRPRTPDGKWRWIMFDLDFGFNLYETSGQSENHLTYIMSGIETRPGSNPPWSTLVPRKLVENPRIRVKFINLLADLLNSKFRSERVVSRINELKDNLDVEGPKHRERWGINQWTFDDHISRMITFANERPGYVRTFVKNYFDTGIEGNVKINSTGGGTVRVNTVKVNSDEFPWSGNYYFNIPVDLVAVPDDGYKFNGWTGSISSAEDSLELHVERSTILYANFSVDSSSAGDIVINEINYNSADDFDSGDWIELYNRSNKTIDIGDWHFSDEVDTHKFVIPAGTSLAPDGYLVLVQNDSAFTDRFPEVQNYIGEMNFGLSGAGEHVRLVNSSDEIIDSLTYDDHLPWPVKADGEGASLELLDPVLDNSAAASWQASSNHGTPGSMNSATTDVKDNNESLIPNSFSLSQNYPNPFNPVTRINYSLPKSCYTSLKVYDLLGQEVVTIYEGLLKSGNYSMDFNAADLASGIYLYRLQADNFVETKKLVLLK